MNGESTKEEGRAKEMVDSKWFGEKEEEGKEDGDDFPSWANHRGHKCIWYLDESESADWTTIAKQKADLR